MYQIGQRVRLTNGHVGVIEEVYVGGLKFHSDNGSIYTIIPSEVVEVL